MGKRLTAGYSEANNPRRSKPVLGPDETPTVEVKHGAYCTVDPVLKQLGDELVTAMEAEREALHKYNGIRRTIEVIDTKRRARLAELEKEGRLYTKPVATRPTADQEKVLKTFAQAVRLGDAELIDAAYNLAKQMKAHHTNWTTEAGETIDVAYTRVKSALERQA